MKESLEGISDYEILINDNASTDRTFELCETFSDKNTHVFRSENVGFAKANNILLKRAKYENLLLLNPDVFGFKNFSWILLFKRWDHINPCFIRLLNEDLTIQVNVGDEISLRRYARSLVGAYSSPAYSEETIYVESGIMAFVLLTRDLIDKVGDIAENYYMYSEDHDWFIRCGKLGYTPQFIPSIELIHIGGASAKSRWKKMDENRVKLDSERILIKTHFSGFEKIILLAVNSVKKLKNSFK
ncbi:glycosyltransferase family 2 protein [Sphingobacterium faecium]|uniref:glycosyltransferase family 2 protein n=1 Tax=Sphingobacterium faecium TaxID=34087 RepID=UPI00320A647F